MAKKRPSSKPPSPTSSTKSIASAAHPIAGSTQSSRNTKITVPPTIAPDQTDAADAADVLAATNDNNTLSAAVQQWRAALRKAPATAGDPPTALPAEFAFYDHAAALYLAKDLDAARRTWQQLLALPESQRHWRSTWAAYMIGRSYVDTDPAKAAASFEQIRDLAKHGFADSTGLASASLGWQARAEWKAHHTLPALHLYLQQAATEDDTAVWSLRDAAAELLEANDARLHEAAADPEARNVITACLLSNFGPYSGGTRGKQEKEIRWLKLLDDLPTNNIAGADRLAWAAYQTGDIPAAKHWLKVGGKETANSPIGHWLQAKLALRAGKTDEAMTHLAAAAHAFPPDEDWPERTKEGDPDYRPAEHAAGELAALKLSRGQYTDALDLLFRNNFQGDAYYIAERVLTVDELKRYIDKNWPKIVLVRAEPPFDGFRREDDPKPPDVWIPAPRMADFPGSNDFRELLARRFTRLGRWKEARPYFLPDNQKRLDSYIAAIRAGRDTKRPAPDRAQSLLEAAHIARRDGSWLLAIYVDPDAAESSAHSPAPFARKADPHAPAQKDELQRVANSAADPNIRFHYRYIAADLAWDAAKLMPDNSDLTATTLIEAGGWIKAQDPKAADRFYKALVTRCSTTDYGREADRLRWFPPLHQNLPAATQP